MANEELFLRSRLAGDQFDLRFPHSQPLGQDFDDRFVGLALFRACVTQTFRAPSWTPRTSFRRAPGLSPHG